MDGEFNVFDEWGNYVGKFTRAGAGDGCLFTIAILLASIVTFLIYMLVQLVVRGLRAAYRKEWEKAAKYLAVPGLIVAWFVCSTAFAVANQAAQETAQEQAQEARRQEYEQFKVDFPSLVTLTDVRRYLGGPLGTWGSVGFAISNQTEETVWFETTNVDGRLGCWFSWGAEEPNHFVEAGKTIELGCEDFSTRWNDQTSRLEPEEGVSPLEELCIRFTSGSSVGEFGYAQFETCEQIE